MVETYEIIPSAKRLIKSLRDIGYDFSTAVADLIDNSIEAGASRIDIVIGFHGNDSYVRISDNGNGMSREELKEAMKYGSEREYQEEDLGKFGLGLKTASMSQCQRFSIASKNNLTDPKNIPVFCWDLSHIERTDKWEILNLKEDDTAELISAPLADHIGTVVLWEKLDRIINFKQPEGGAAREKLILMCRELETHLGIVFHKFLANEVPERQLKIYLNNNKILPWDPFGRDESKTKVLSPIKIKLIYEDISDKIILQPYVLPHKDEFSSQDVFRRLSGPLNWNQQQGFYIYRANRMIQCGGWCGLRTSDEHTKLARIELNFSPKIDNLFKINVAKMRVQLPSQIKENIEDAVRPVALLARECYDHAGKISSSIPTSSSSDSYQDQNLLNKQTFPVKQDNLVTNKTLHLFTLDEIERHARGLSNETEKKIVSDIFSRLRKKLFGDRT